MKNILIAIIGISCIFGFVFCFYAFFGFMTWIFNDPFHWISPPPKEQYIEDPDVIACRAKGGMAVKSLWNGQLKECKI